MEHEAFVPFPVDVVRQTLTNPDRLSRCVPGLRIDTLSAAELNGKLQLRIGTTTITYRGVAKLSHGTGGSITLEAEGREARGNGGIKAALTITPIVAEESDRGPGTMLHFLGQAEGDGRLARFEAGPIRSAARRLLDRCTDEITRYLSLPHDAPEPPGASAMPPQQPGLATPPPQMDIDEDAWDGPSIADLDAAAAAAAADEEAAALDPFGLGEDEFFVDEGSIEAPSAVRRTLIGRSAEEVDHAPPRGRYVPVPAAQPTSAAAVLRWAVPAAAALLASAVVVRRVLRGRR